MLLVDVKGLPPKLVVALEFAVIVIDPGFGVLFYPIFAEMREELFEVKLKVEFVPLKLEWVRAA